MKKIAIIAEFNPFHNGHKLLVDSVKENFDEFELYIILSDAFMQRGEPQFIDLKQRTLHALNFGADVVVSLPYPFSTQRADKFAEGAIHLCKQLKIDVLAFGVEDTFELPNFTEKISPRKNDVARNLSANFDSITNIPSSSNNILAYFYMLKSFENFPSLQFHFIKRNNNHRHEDLKVSKVTSATSIRKHFHTSSVSKYIPYDPKAFHDTVDWNSIYKFLQHQLTINSIPQIELFACVGKSGIAQILKKNVTSASFESFLNACLHKHVTKSTIMRACINILLNIKQDELDNYYNEAFQERPLILGFRKEKSNLLKGGCFLNSINDLQSTELKQLYYKIHRSDALFRKSVNEQQLNILSIPFILSTEV